MHTYHMNTNSNIYYANCVVYMRFSSLILQRIWVHLVIAKPHNNLITHHMHTYTWQYFKTK
jgi:hypothetical protein